MRIAFVEVKNFRKLESVRIDFAEKVTLCVGANNSGKTSAMVALSHFLVNSKRFSTNDFTLSNWAAINAIGKDWQTTAPTAATISSYQSRFEAVLPSLDLWLEVSSGELHYVRDLIPSLDWNGGRLGIRIRFEPKNTLELASTFLRALKATVDTKTAAAKTSGGVPSFDPTLWPTDLRSFLDRKLESQFSVQSYILDPNKCALPEYGVAKPQPLPETSEPMDSNPLAGLIRIDEISAQRGLGDSTADQSGYTEAPEYRLTRERKRLSEQLRSYYDKHLNPAEFPEPADLQALESIEKAQKVYNERLASGFAAAIEELENLNYPGVTDPKLRISTQLRPSDGLRHNAAVQYDVSKSAAGMEPSPLTLPEEYNGLGYQNLISMVFKLMSFRDAWMRVGKAAKDGVTEAKNYFLPPLHLVLIEEPEAYLHAQVQQVFLRKAYDVLRNHPELREKSSHLTQLIVSTHSSHIAHECEFASLRYFRRLPAKSVGLVPTSAVINLSEVFGPDDQTKRFVTRYLRATHCDLFFADAAILVEGSAERLLVPHFIRKDFKKLHCCYITMLEIDGSHAHRLQPLIEHLGLITLIITDLDSAKGTGRHEVTPPQRNEGQVTRNSTLKTWHPVIELIDDLLKINAADKVKQYPNMPLFSIRVAYQVPIQIVLKDATLPVEALTKTFEDALVLENLKLFREMPDEESVGHFKGAIASATTVLDLTNKLFLLIEKLEKAAFALDLLWLKEPHEIIVPTYIREGLEWLEEQLQKRQGDDPTTVAVPGVPGGVA